MAISAGTRLGHYEILAPLGGGGMGEVYRARDTRLGREVAIKRLPEAFARDTERLARFEREARLLAALNHPHVAAIYGLEQADDRRFLVLELVPGPTLAERLAAGPLPVNEALGIGRQIAEALEAAHSKGIIHRDLKPANIKIIPEGQVKVLDFGLAKALGAEPSGGDPSESPTVLRDETRAGVVLGTVAYMSPEQARGKALDPRTDIWSFGCVLYEMLTGRQAFSGETISDTLTAVLSGEPDWRTLPERTPVKIRDLLRRCLQKDLHRRLQHVGDARIEIEETLAAPAADQATTTAIGAPSKRWRQAVVWSLIGLSVGALAAAIVVWRLKSPSPMRSGMHFSAVTNFAGVEAQPSLSPDGRSVAFVSNRDGQFDIYVGLVTGGNLVRITNDLYLKMHPRWSPDGTKIAYARLNEDGLSDIWIVPALGGSPRKIVTDADDPAWSPDGRTFAYANLVTNTLWTCDATGGNARPLTQQEERFLSHRQPAFSRDGRQVAFVRRIRAAGAPYGELDVVDVATGKARQLTEDRASALSPAWSPDGQFIYFASSRGGATNIWRIAVRGGLPEQITAGQGDDAELDVSADGQRLVFSTYRENINLAELAIGAKASATKLKWLTTDAARTELGPVYSPDGTRIAYFSARKGTENEGIWLMNADGSNPVRLVDDDRLNIFPRWAPDAQSLIYISRARELTGNREFRRIAIFGGLPEKFSPALSHNPFGDVGPDGRLVLLRDAGVQLWDPKSNQTQSLKGIAGHSINHQWSPDGRKIAYILPARRQGDADAGLWVYDLASAPRQVFRGWVAWYAWAGPGELFLVEGKPDLNAPLWRVRSDSGVRVLTPARIRLISTSREVRTCNLTSIPIAPASALKPWSCTRPTSG